MMIITTHTPLRKVLEGILDGEVNRFTEERMRSYVLSQTKGKRDSLLHMQKEIEDIVKEWLNRFYMPMDGRLNAVNTNSRELDDIFFEERLYEDEGRIALTPDYMYDEIARRGFINGLHRQDVETAWRTNDTQFLRAQWEDAVLGLVRALQTIVTGLLANSTDNRPLSRPKPCTTEIRTKDWPEVFGMDTCCRLTGYAKHTLYKLTAKNGIPCFRAGNNGRRLMFRREDVLKWLLNRRQETTEEFIMRMDGKLAARISNF